MAQNTAEEQTDVDTKTNIAANRIADALDMDRGDGIIARNWPSHDKDVIIVTWENDMGVNGFHKASLIDDVYQSGANVELATTEEENCALRFQVRD